MLAGETDESEELANSCSGELTVADPPHSSRPFRPRRASEIDARTRREHEHAQAHPPGGAAPPLKSPADDAARSISRTMRREHEGGLVGFPVPSARTLDRAQSEPEEAVRRQRVEAERLSRLAPGEWQLWIDDSAERLGIARATLEASVKSIIAQRAKHQRIERADALRADERERRRIAREKTEAQREQDRGQRRVDKKSEQNLKEKRRVFAALIKVPNEQHQIRLVALARSLDEDVAIIIDEFVAFVAANVAIWDPNQVEPWHEQVDTQALLLELIMQIQRYVVLHNDAAIAVALWTMMAWVHTEIATHSPNLMVTSTEPESGKSTLLAVLGLLAPRPFCTVEVTGPGLCHIVDRYHPTLIIDEGDNLFHRKTDLLHIVNAGWSRGSKIPRLMHGVLHQFDPFCPKIIGLKGMKMPDMLASRGIVIKLWPKTPDEKVSDFGFTDDDEFSTLRRKLVRWSADNAAVLKDLRPLLPAGFDNRLAANWRLLLAIADYAGGTCPKRAREVAVRLSRKAYKPSEGIRLLEALRAIFATRETITSAELVQRLLAEPDDEWGEFRGRTPITQRIIAALLAEYEIRPVVLHPTKRASLSARGYRRLQFADAFARFLPLDPNIRTLRGRE